MIKELVGGVEQFFFLGGRKYGILFEPIELKRRVFVRIGGDQERVSVDVLIDEAGAVHYKINIKCRVNRSNRNQIK